MTTTKPPFTSDMIPSTSNLMTYAVWCTLTPAQRAQQTDYTDLLKSPLHPYYGQRVEVVDRYGNKRRFWVGRSTGWKPVYLEVKTTRSMGGDIADTDYQSVRFIRSK